MSALDEFTIIIGDQRFTLLRDQMMRDAPNYFTAFFNGPFRETSEGVREMKLYRDPYLFKFVHLYLSGYEILPLPKDIPCPFSEESRLKCLLLDARFYGLDTLAEEVEALVARSSGDSKDGKNEKENWKVFTRETIDEPWIYAMTLFDRETFNFYMQGAKGNRHYRVMPMDVSSITDGLENIYTYCHRSCPESSEDLYFAIGKVKET